MLVTLSLGIFHKYHTSTPSKKKNINKNPPPTCYFTRYKKFQIKLTEQNKNVSCGLLGPFLPQSLAAFHLCFLRSKPHSLGSPKRPGRGWGCGVRCGVWCCPTATWPADVSPWKGPRAPRIWKQAGRVSCAAQSPFCRFSVVTAHINITHYQKHKAGQSQSLTWFPCNNRKVSLP